MKKHVLLTDYLKVADIHAARLKGALEKFAHLMPLSAEGLAKLPLDQIAFLDMMTMRFGDDLCNGASHRVAYNRGPL